MNLRCFLFLSFALLFALFVESADIDPNPELRATILKANDMYLDARFDDGISLLQQFEKSNGKSPATSFFIANGYWWKIFRVYVYDKEAKTTPFDNNFEFYLSETMRLSEERLARNRNDVEGLFYLGNAYGLKSRVKGLRGNYYSAGRDAAKGKDYMEQILKIDPDQYDALYSLGMYNYLAGALPGYAKVLKFFLFLPSGNKEDGLAQLKLAGQKSTYFAAESQLILARFYADHEERPAEAIRIVQTFHANHPDNAWFHYWLGTLYSDEMNDYNQAGKIYSEVIEKCDQGTPGYTTEVRNQAWLKMARVYFRQLYPEKAIEEIRSLIQNKPKEPAWILPKAYLELGNIYDQIGMRNEATLAYKQVLSFRNYRDYHEQATKLLDQKYNQKLADIYRLNLDGRRLAAAGRFEDAEAAFNNVLNQYPKNEQTLYAIAEMYFMKGSYSESTKLLDQILDRNPKEPKWLVPGAYVRLGQVYQAQKQAEAARRSYQKALETDFLISDDRNLAKRALRQIGINKPSK
jgi:tetratricopeptide (TPR) repeat protein